MIFKIIKVVNYIVVPLSLVTNSMSIAVFVRMRRKIQSELFLVFVSLSVVDTLALILKFDTFLTGIGLSKNMALRYYVVGCQVLNWLESCGQVCSSYFILLYTFERFISVRFPLKRAIICSGRRVRIAFLCILVLFPISQVYDLILFKHRRKSCGVMPPGGIEKLTYGYLTLYSQFVIGMLMPYCCIALLNGMIVYHMTRYQRKRAALKASTISSEERTQRSMTAMLITASTYSLLMMMPLIIVNCLDPKRSSTSTGFVMFSVVALRIISPWNYCGNFFFYVIGGRQFRDELFNIIGLRCWRSRGKYKSRRTDTVHHSFVLLISSSITVI